MINRRFCARLPHACSILMLLASLATVAVAQPTSPDTHPEKPAPVREIRPLVFGASLFPRSTSTLASFTVDASSDACGVYDGSARFAVEPEIFGLWLTPWHRDLWLTARAGYRSLDARLVSNETARPFDNAVETGIDTAIFVTRYDVARSGIELSVGGAWSFGEHLIAGLAPSLLFAGDAVASHTDSIVAPSEARFASGGWTRPFSRGSAVDFASLGLGLELSVRGVVPMGGRIAAYPGVRADYSLTSHASNVSWRTWSIGATLGVGFDVSSHAADTIPLVAVVDTLRPQPRRPYLRATIIARGIDENGSEYPNPIIEIEETPWVEVVPLLPFVFFDSASSAIASRYRRIDAAAARRFSLDSLADIDPIDVHWHTLNVIGSRLRANPRVTGIITGTLSGDEGPLGPRLAQMRADAVRGYLVDVWGIEPARLRTATAAGPMSPSAEDTPEGRAENRRVQFSFSDPGILTHATIRRLASIASPPAVKFYPEIVADSAIAEWRIAVVQGEKELLRFAGSGDEESLKQNKLWSLADLRINRDLSEIRYRLDVRDVTGQTTAADGRFRVIERARRSPGDSLGPAPRIAEHFLVGFNFNSAELLPQHRQRLEEIAQTISPDDELLLVGYTDRIGMQERNRQLSLERARVASDALHETRFRDRLPEEAAITVRGYGPQEELFDNALPEGRMFSRMVRIVVTSYRDE
jgi:outer membrane protein OmpA-like peptidoglycan-associated protein